MIVKTRRNAGQGTLEYILLLFVVVAIGGGILYKFNTAFAQFAQGYFGNYLSCLLETGELPTLGGDGGPKAVGAICDAEFAPFDIANGRVALKDSGGTSSSSKSESSEKSASDSKSESKSGSKDSKASEGTSTSKTAASEKSQSSGLGDGGTTRNIPTSRADGTTPIARDGRTGSIPLSTADLGKKSKTGRDGNVPAERSAKTDSKNMDAESGRLRFVPSSEVETDSSRLRSSLVPASENDLKYRGKRIPANVALKKKGDGSDADVGMTFPDFIRYLLIAGILIALILFLGGQAMQINNGNGD